MQPDAAELFIRLVVDGDDGDQRPNAAGDEHAPENPDNQPDATTEEEP